MNRGKGSQFERQICKQLSLWWTVGERDDIFWRSSQSGGRATQRMKFGKKTFGSYGDVAAVDPFGQPLLEYWTIELKRGKSHGSPWELLECTGECQKFEQTLAQVYRSHIHSGSEGWLLICKKDFRHAMAYIDWRTISRFGECLKQPHVRYGVRVVIDRKPVILHFAGMRLDGLLKRLKPSWITDRVNYEPELKEIKRESNKRTTK